MSSSLKPRFPYWVARKPNPRCLMSDPAEPHTLRLRLGPPLPPHGCFNCAKQDSYNGIDHFSPFVGDYHFYCPSCDVQFHEECHKWPRERRHPFHLQHPLSFSFHSPDRTLVHHGHLREYYEQRVDKFNKEYDGKCDWCGKNLKLKYQFYRCSLCGFSLCRYCSDEDPLVTITNPQNHPHPLTLFPIPLSLPCCNACGLADARDSPTAYVCLQCRYIVHEDCLDLPRVIKITYHPQHHLSHTPFLPPGKWSCDVCHQSIDPKYGAYSCTQGCPYALHSRCATDRYIWDEKELEWEPEEEEEHDDTKDTQPFVRIGDKEIRHFSHDEHHLHLFDGDNSVREDQCEACVLPIGSGRFYCCMSLSCRFFLHETCASLPRKMYHKLHRHRLFLDLLPSQGYSPLNCWVCNRTSIGFMYRCEDCPGFLLDVRCASSFFHPFNHKSHQHHLLAINFETHRLPFTCHICWKKWGFINLKCINGCDFVMCFECATLPDEVRYKFDDHPLTLSCGEDDADGPYWCELCEKQLDPKKWFYTCHRCCVTVHVHCVFGPSIYMKVGHRFKHVTITKSGPKDEDEFKVVTEIEVVRNNMSTRPICIECCDRCQETVFYKTVDGSFCSLHLSTGCLQKHLQIIKTEASKE